MAMVAATYKTKPYNAEEMREPALHVAKLAGRQHVDDRGTTQPATHFAAANLLPGLAFRISPVGEEIRGDPFVDDIEERAAHDQNDHDDHVGLHDGRRDCRDSIHSAKGLVVNIDCRPG